jgi:hypothetical protein
VIVGGGPLEVSPEPRPLPLTTQGREVALAALAERRANRPEPIDDASLPAGSPMHYYCLSCGHLADVKPEGWFRTLPRKLCDECQALADLGWLE